MKKTRFTFAAILAVGFLAVSYGGGGNINKVKNGVFSNYDNTITIGKALENNADLKGGKWRTVEMDGRNYVLYTVTSDASWVSTWIAQGIKTEYPNVEVAKLFKGRMTRTWETFKSSMSDEETGQVKQILTKALDSGLSEAGYANLEENPLVTVDGAEVVLSFVMNQDGTFATNMLETYTDVTLRCFNNLKVRISAYSSDDPAYILDSIYKKYRRPLFG